MHAHGVHANEFGDALVLAVLFLDLLHRGVDLAPVLAVQLSRLDFGGVLDYCRSVQVLPGVVVHASKRSNHLLMSASLDFLDLLCRTHDYHVVEAGQLLFFLPVLVRRPSSLRLMSRLLVGLGELSTRLQVLNVLLHGAGGLDRSSRFTLLWLNARGRLLLRAQQVEVSLSGAAA